MRRPSTNANAVPWATLAGLVLVLSIVALGIAFMADARARRLASETPAALAEPEPRTFVISPGREQDVRSLLAPLESGALTGVEQFSFSIEHNLVEVQLFGPAGHEGDACPGPEWTRVPGSMLLARAPLPADPRAGPGSGERRLRVRGGEFWLRWHWCGESLPPSRAAELERLAERFAAAPELDRIWQPVQETERPEQPASVRESGLLSPVAEALDLDRESLTMLVLGVGTLLAGVVAFVLGAWLPGPTPIAIEGPRSRHAIAGALLLLSASLRLWTTDALPLDADESWAYPIGGSIFAENHDPWVHPPLFHLLGQPWVRAIDWSPGDALTWLRAPHVIMGLIASSLAIVYVCTRARALWVCALALPVALAPKLAATLVLARPYALASMLVVICAVALWPIARQTAPAPERVWVTRLRWWLALVAAGLAAWTDVIAGGAAVVLVFGRLMAEPRSRWFVVLGVIALLGVWIGPLVPGSLEAATHHVDPDVSQAVLDNLGIERPGDVRPDPDLTRRLPAFSVFGISTRSGLARALALALALLLAWVGWRGGRHRIEAALPLVLLLAWLLVASELVHLRPRNVAFTPVLVAVFAVLGIRRPRSDASKPEQT